MFKIRFLRGVIAAALSGLVMVPGGAIGGGLTMEALQPGMLMPKLGAYVPQMTATTTIGPDLTGPITPSGIFWFNELPNFVGATLRSADGMATGIVESQTEDAVGYPSRVMVVLNGAAGTLSGTKVTLAAAILNWDYEKNTLTSALPLSDLKRLAMTQARGGPSP